MRILFISKEYRTIAIETLAAFLKKQGHEVICINNPGYFSTGFNIKANIRKINPDLIAFSVDSISSAWYLSLARKIKGYFNIPLVFGGIHATIAGEKLLGYSFIDYVVIGEGEYALEELARALEQNRSVGEIKNLCYRTGDKQIVKNPLRPMITDLDALPFPDKNVYYGDYYSSSQSMGNRGVYALMTSRGCPFRCSYCHHDYIKQIYPAGECKVRFRSIQNVMSELKNAVANADIKRIVFWDDNFTLNERRLQEFLEIYKKEINLPFYCPTHSSFINENVAKALASVKGIRVALGLQTINDTVRKEILNRSDRAEQIKKAIHLLDTYNIAYSVDILFGIPGEQVEDFTGLLDFFPESFSTRNIRFFNLRFFENASITDLARQRNLISPRQQRELEKKGFTYAASTREISRLKNFYTVHYFFSDKTVRRIIERRLYGLFMGPYQLYQFFGNVYFLTSSYTSKKKDENRLLKAAFSFIVNTLGYFKDLYSMNYRKSFVYSLFNPLKKTLFK